MILDVGGSVFMFGAETNEAPLFVWCNIYKGGVPVPTSSFPIPGLPLPLPFVSI